MFMGNQNHVFIIGHKNPDTDSVCSAIGYAYLKNILDKRCLYVPARAGSLNSETKFVLDRFGIEAPMEIDSLAATVSDMKLKKPIVASPNNSIRDAASLIRKNNIHSLPIIDDHKKFLGIVGLKNIAEYYIGNLGRRDLTKTPVDLTILLDTLNGKVITNPRKIDRLTGRVFIAAMQKTSILNRIRSGDIVIVGDRADVQLDLINAGCLALIITGDSAISPEVRRLAKANGTLIISSPHDTFTTARLLDLSTPLYSIMSKDVPVAELYTHISELKIRVVESPYRCALIVDSDNRLLSIVTRTDLLHLIRKKVILVDHNEVAHAVDAVQEADILEIIDHHRVGDISTLMPIHVRNEPIGSTCTIVADLMFLHQIDIPQTIAGLLLSGILSDTLLLTLSTTTDKDKKLAHKLTQIAAISIEDYGKELVKASIRIKERSAKEILYHDFKDYELSDKHFAVSQIMVIDKEELSAKERDIMGEMDRLTEEKRYDLVVLLITNPLEQGEEIWVKGDKRILEKAFDVEVKNDKCFVPQTLSRKKEFIPKIGYALS
jgi:manganese-dependent inorganic pyrophosphatase